MGNIGMPPKIEIGRLIAIPVFAFFMTIRTYVVFGDIKALLPISTVKLVGLIHHILILSFYALIILLYFLRSSARSTNRSLVTNTIALLGTFTPFVFPFLGKPELINPTMVIISDLMIILGLVISIYSLSVLGRNFSIIPQTRNLVQRGPYRLVRHPIYLGELITVFGIVLSGLSISRLVVYFILVVFQIYRASQEEKLLYEAFPEYEDYSSKTVRFIPGVF